MWIIYDINPGPNGDEKRIIVSRDTRESIIKILNVLEETNVNFDYYKVEEKKEDDE